MVVDGHLFSLHVKSSIYLDANGRRLVTRCIGLLQTYGTGLRWIEDGRPAVRRMGGGVKPDGETAGDRLAVQKRSDAQHV